MHPDNKLTNHGKQVSSDSQSQLSNVTQQQEGANKGLGAGSQSVMKTKRERSVSVDSGEQRDALEPDAKEGVMRSKRRCVLEKKQPYSGDEWCSGPDTEEEEDKPQPATHWPLQGLSGPSSKAGPGPPPPDPSLTPGMGRGLGPGGQRSEMPRPAQQVVYVFTTSLANSAAESVMHGHSDSILLFHQQNVPRTKQLEQCAPSGKHPSLSGQLSSSSTPPMGTPKSQSGTPRPASVVGCHLQAAGSRTPSSTGHPDSEPPQTRLGGPGVSNNSSSTPSHQPGSAVAPTPCGPGPGPGGGGRGGEGKGVLPHPSAGVSPSGSPSVLSAHLQVDVGVRGGGGPGGNGGDGGLSKEQLEHRERSLQTLRDIERLLLRSGTAGGAVEPPGPNNNPNNVNNINTEGSGGGPMEDGENSGNGNNTGGNSLLLPPMGQMKRYEEPLRSIISQTQQLGGPGGMDDSPMGGPHPHSLPPHHSPGGLDMGPLLGPDGLTPEQVAWRQLQEEYYQEKRRQQEIQPNPHTHPQHFRMMQEMSMGQGGPPIMMRGPPPPYHSKPGEQQWGPAGMGPGGMGPGNPRMIDMHHEGPRGPRFLGQMQRGPPGGGGFPGSPGGVLSIEGLSPQRAPRPGMWIEDLPPNMMGGGRGPFYHGGPGGGPPQHMQGDPERLLTREDMFRIMEKRQLQGLHHLELERIAQQQQQGMGGPRMMEGPGGFPNQGMGRGPGSREDPMDFLGSREIMGSPGGGVGGGGPQMRDLVDSSLGPGGMNMNMNVNMMNQQMNQQQQMMLQKLRGGGRGGRGGGGPLGDLLSQEDIARIRAAQNGGGRGGNKVMIQGPDGPLQFPNQGPFPGGPGGGEGGYLQGPGVDMFGLPDQHGGGPHMGGTSRLSHMPMGGGGGGGGPRCADLGPHHPSDLSINVNPSMVSPAMHPPPHQLKSPSLIQEPSPLMSSPSTAGLKSPSQISSAGGSQSQQHPLPPASGAGTPSSSSMKSPQVMGPSLGLRSPSGSPGRLKSPAMVASPGWTSSPKTALPSPGGPSSGKGLGNGGSSSTETGPPRSSNSTPISQPGSMAPSMPFTSSPDNPPTQNPLSLIMSQMSKYAMPSSTPLYHDAIKTIATSDDEMMPDRPLLSGVNIGGNPGNHQGSMLLSQSSIGPHSGQLSPNPMGLNGMNPAMMGYSLSPMHPQNQIGGFPRMQHPGGPMHSPLGGMPPQFSQQNPEDVIPPQQLQHMLSKGLSHPHQRGPHPSDSFMGPDGPDLSDVIRPTHSGIPEFDLSRIIPSDKPSSTLQYFPKAEGMSGGQQGQGNHPNPHQGQPGSQGPGQGPPPPQLLKQLSAPGPHSNAPSSNPHIANLQNMMAEHQLPPHPSHCGMGRHGIGGMPQGGSRGMGGPGGGGMGGHMMHPGHLMGRTGMGMGPGHTQQQLQQQAMMANSLLHGGHPGPQPHPSMMSSQQHSLMAQQNLMLMQAKQRGMGLPGDPFGQQGGPLMSPQGPMMGPGPPHPQGGMMGPGIGPGPQGPLRQRGMSLDSPLGYGPGPGSMANMPF
ncbi:B-cell CLL/lymphoma 9-like protein isoform X2 [Coregonus clupeaformis]|uniref:B-cell CLL/lymphoma 9-like protein isoform X2 n=1 Tax=Coregonus clupeaformis TaxID=59861 RepID=UPI001BE02A17|nr:B-cell CLL/lymphoma 9-like protein isoform X2 [Coregonus clupeaformis]